MVGKVSKREVRKTEIIKAISFFWTFKEKKSVFSFYQIVAGNFNSLGSLFVHVQTLGNSTTVTLFILFAQRERTRCLFPPD